jgi:hypothetical protein
MITFHSSSWLHRIPLYIDTVRKYRPQNDHMERSDLAKRFFIAGWERERAERAKRERERGAGA